MEVELLLHARDTVLAGPMGQLALLVGCHHRELCVPISALP